MAEVKPARDIFKKPRTEPDSSSQKPFLAIFFSLLAYPGHARVSACSTWKMQQLHVKKCRGRKKNERKGQIAQGSSCLSCTGACKVAEILRLSLDGEEMSISSIAFIPRVKLSPYFATPVPPPLPLPPVPLGPSRLSEA